MMRIDNPYHEGELAIQTMASERTNADRNGRAIADSIMPGALKFIAQQPMLVLASVDPDGNVWSSLLTGPQGFAQAPDQRTVQLDLSEARSHDRDPLWDNIEHHPNVGMLAIDLATRRRLRINGRINPQGATAYELQVSEAYPNCPQYIQRRHLNDSIGRDDQDTNAFAVLEGHTLTADQRRWIESADTFFVASVHPERGADASHRGGHTGFVRVLDDRTLRVPDYAGNSMFNTLGNFRVNPQAGLLFVDFDGSRTLQLTGQATIRFDLEDDPAGPTGGTGRYWDFAAEKWIEAPMAYPLRAEFLDYWPKNPQRSACADGSLSQRAVQ